MWNAKDRRRYTHCGVKEFTAEEGRATLPYWMMSLLGCEEGGMIAVESAKPPQGSFVKLRPQQKKFTELHDPRAVLETYLRNFSCLTRGDTIKIHYNRQEFDIDIVEVRAHRGGATDVISIVETDVNVDFDRPADMPDSPTKEEKEAVQAAAAAKAAAAGGGGMTFGNTLLDRQSAGADLTSPPAAAAAAEAAPAAPSAFTGTGRTISGRAPAAAPAAAAAATAAERRAAAGGGYAGGRTLGGATVAAPPPGAGRERKTDSFGRELNSQGEEAAAPRSRHSPGRGGR